jgi:hypothetical protein
MRSTPANQLADRYPGHLADTIGDAALPSPTSLVIVIGRPPAQLAKTPNSVQVTSITETMPGRFTAPCFAPGCPPSPNPNGLAYFPNDAGGGANSIDLILSIVALAILTPVLIFIPGQIQAFVSSFAIILIGLFIAGPWLTMAAARAMARWTSRPSTLIAARTRPPACR